MGFFRRQVYDICLTRSSPRECCAKKAKNSNDDVRLRMHRVCIFAWRCRLMVRGAVGLAEKLSVSKMVIGMTVVAFGTSELLIALNAALSGSSGLAVGNLVGSNIASILLILGVSGLILPIAVDSKYLLETGGCWPAAPPSLWPSSQVKLIFSVDHCCCCCSLDFSITPTAERPSAPFQLLRF